MTTQLIDLSAEISAKLSLMDDILPQLERYDHRSPEFNKLTYTLMNTYASVGPLIRQLKGAAHGKI